MCSFTNYACQGYNITQLTASLGLAATEVPTVNKQLSDCAINNNNGGNGNNNQCSAVLPNLFAWTVNNTVVPITSYCNPSDPNDANAKMGCSPVTVVNGKTYFLFKPLQGSVSCLSSYSPVCVCVLSLACVCVCVCSPVCVCACPCPGVFVLVTASPPASASLLPSKGVCVSPFPPQFGQWYYSTGCIGM